MCCVSTSVNAATTSPVWYLTDVREVGITSDDGYYHREGTNQIYALVFPKTYNEEGVINTSQSSLSGTFYKNVSYFNALTSPIGGQKLSYALIKYGYEPYSYYEFAVDYNWRVMVETDLTASSNAVWFCGSKNARANVSDTQMFRLNQNEEYTYGETYTSPNQNIWITKDSWSPYTRTTTSWFSPVTGSQSTTYTTSETLYNTVNINDLIISVVPDPTTMSNDTWTTVSGNASFLLFCPIEYVPDGLKFGDIWPIGNVLSPHASAEENAANQFSGDKDSIETVGEVLDTGINNITDITTQGIGDSTITNMDIIIALFRNVFPWWFDIFGLMFLFGVLGIVVRRALHD